MANTSEKFIIEQLPARFHDQPVLASQLDEIALHLEEWESLAPFIEISTPEMKEISENYHGNYRLQKRQALRVWRQKCEHKATINKFVCILCQQGLRSLAEKIVEICQKKWPTSITVFNKYLCNYYSEGLAHPSNHQWLSEFGFELPQIYIDLTFHEVPVNETESLLCPTDVNDGYKEIELENILKPSSSRMVILLEGVGGSGKTTLAWYACKQWAAGTLLQQFQLLVHVQLNNPRLRKLKNLELKDLIPDSDIEACNEIATAIIDSKGKGVCFFLEGLDETPEHLRHSLFLLMLEGRKLCHLSFILTTRPDGGVLLTLRRVLSSRILIKGFDKNRLGKFLDCSLGAHSDEMARLVQMFEINPQLEALASLPINAVILSFLVKYFKDELPVTQTGLFHLLMCHVCIRHLQLKGPERNQLFVFHLPDDLPSALKEAFESICSLAYQLSKENKRFFSAREVGKLDNTLGLLQIYQNISMYGLREYYSFPHLSLQQFLAAIHLSRIKDIEQAVFVKNLLNKDPLNQIIPFFAGLTHLPNKVVVRILSDSLKHVSSTSTILKELKSPNSTDPRRKALTLMNSLYECQNETLIADQIEVPDEASPVCIEMCKAANIKETPRNLKVVVFRFLPLTPRDCLSIGYFGRIKSRVSTQGHDYDPYTFDNISYEQIMSFDLSSCSLSDSGIQALMTELGDGIYAPTPMQIHLTLGYNLLNEKSLTCIKHLISEHFNTSVLCLGMCLHPHVVNINTALKLILEGLNRSVCFQLDMSQNNLRLQHIHYLLLLLCCCPLLTWLTMKSFQLGKLRAMNLFCGALRLYSNLGTLDLTSCGILDSGLVILGKAVSRHRCLIHLRMFENKFTDRGLAKFLRLFIGNRYSKMTFLGVKMNTEHEKILKEINLFRSANNMTTMNSSFEGRPYFINTLYNISTLNALDHLKDTKLKKELLPFVTEAVDDTVTRGLKNKYL